MPLNSRGVKPRLDLDVGRLLEAAPWAKYRRAGDSL
jgi:hypothetical protein